MSKNKTYNKIKEYLIVRCYPLNDQYECDADRMPICVTDDYSQYDDDSTYEIYAIYNDGRIKMIREINL